MRIPFFALFAASAVFAQPPAQSPAFWQDRQLMPSPFEKPAPRAVTKPLVGPPTQVRKEAPATSERCTPPMPAMRRPGQFSSAMPVAPADPAVDPEIVLKVRVCRP